jgi:hypothetical protein
MEMSPWRSLFFAFCLVSLQGRAVTLTVNAPADVVDVTPGDGLCETAPGNGVCTLRAAIQEAGALPGANSIVIPAGTYNLSATPTCSYRLAANSNLVTENMSALCVRGTVTIAGAGSNTTIIDAGGAGGTTCCGSYFTARGFVVDAQAVVNISGVTVQHGVSNGGFGFIGGGGINNQGKLTLTKSLLTANTGLPGGGAIFNNGTIFVDATDFIGNSAAAYGGAALYNAGTATITNSTLSFGASLSLGGGIVNIGTLAVSGSTINNNSAATNGGGIHNEGPLTLTNVTISGNTSTNYTGIDNSIFGVVVANNVTIAFNHASNFIGGVGNNSGAFTMRNTIIGANVADNLWPDCGPGNALVSQGHNLVSNTTACTFSGATATDILGQDPALAALALNGGPSQTHALLSTSPAVNAGDPSAPGSGGSACSAIDQRGTFRPQNGRCDIGAFERASGLLVTGILPNHAGNSGLVEAVVSGAGMVAGATVKLRRTGQSDVGGAPVTVQDGNSALAVTFDLTGKLSGSWDLVLTNPDATTVSVPGGFTVESGGASDLWAEVVGPAIARPGSTARFSIVYGNRGNIDAFGVPLTLSTSTQTGLTILFPIAAPPSQSGQVVNDWSKAPLYVLPAPSAGTVNVPLFLPIVPAGFTGVLSFTLDVPGTFLEGQTFPFSALRGDPFFNPGLDANIQNSIVAGARAYAQANLGVVIPDSRVPSLNQYLANQLQGAISDDRAQLNSSIGTSAQVYNLGLMTIDLAEYAAASAPLALSPSLQDTSGPAQKGHLARAAGGSAPGTSNCGGQAMTPGTSCTQAPAKVPDPNDDKKPFTAADCRSIGGHHVNQDGDRCVPNRTDCSIIQIPFFTDPDCLKIPIKTSIDPNAKWGPVGSGTQHFRNSISAFNYEVEFENLATASLATQRVVVTDQLDTAVLDLSTFSLGPISFGPYSITPPPGLQQYTTGLDLRPAMNLQVKIEAGLNPATGLITWRFTSLDPATGQLTTDPFAGFLPPNVAPPQGDAHLLYSIAPKSSLTSGATICNQAIVIFDSNAPIFTQNWCNTLDFVRPSSHVLALPANFATPTFTVQWTGSDAVSGIGDYTIYVSDNAGPYSAWLSHTLLTQASYAGVDGHTYRFYSIAQDLAGNIENAKTVPEAVTNVSAIVAPVVTWNNPVSIPYGTALTASQLNATAPVTGAFVYSPPLGSVLNAGNGQTLSVVFTPSNALLPPVNASVLLNVTPVPLTIAALPASRYAGVANPPLAASITGLVNNDNITVSATTTATIGSPSGPYPITPVVSDPGQRISNYNVTITNSTLIVAARPAAIASLSTTNLAFGKQDLFAASAKVPVVVSNIGTADLPLGISLGGSNASDFALSNACGTILPAGTNCTIGVTFTPSALKLRTATIALTYNNGNSPENQQSVALSGNGILTYGLYATGADCGAVRFADATSTDSFDSSLGTYALSKANSLGNIGVIGNITLSDSVLVNGGIYARNPSLGRCVNGSPGITISDRGMATGGYLPLGTPLTFTTPAAVTPGASDVKPSRNTSLSAGDYRDITFSGNTLTLSPGLYRVNSITLSDSAKIVISPAGPVTILIGGLNSINPIHLKDKATLNSMGIPANLLVVYGGTGTVELSDQADFRGILYAPNANVRLSGDAGVFGAAVVKTAVSLDNTKIHYDRVLGR